MSNYLKKLTENTCNGMELDNCHLMSISSYVGYETGNIHHLGILNYVNTVGLIITQTLAQSRHTAIFTLPVELFGLLTFSLIVAKIYIF